MVKKKSKTSKPAVSAAPITSLSSLVDAAAKKFGSGTIMMGEGSIVDVSVIPTGIASLDMALGCGGIPRGRIIELYGAESGGKTTTCLQIVANCQKYWLESKRKRGVAAFIDAEHAFDPVWAENVGVDMSKLLISQPGSGEEALSIVEMLCKSGLVDLVVVDSVAALIPKCMLDDPMNDKSMGAQAQLMSKGVRALVGICSKHAATVIFINQIRMKTGIVFGNPEQTPGGRALKFYSSVRLDVRRESVVTSGQKKDENAAESIGCMTKVKIVKNKVAAPFRMALYQINFGSNGLYGVDTVASDLTVGTSLKIIEQSGSWYVYGDLRLGSGREKATAFLRGSPEILEKLRDQIYSSIRVPSQRLQDQSAEDILDAEFQDSELDVEPVAVE